MEERGARNEEVGNRENPKALSAVEGEPEYQKFEGICPECGQPFAMEYVRNMEETLRITKDALKRLTMEIREKDKIIESLRVGLARIKTGKNPRIIM